MQKHLVTPDYRGIVRLTIGLGWLKRLAARNLTA